MKTRQNLALAAAFIAMIAQAPLAAAAGMSMSSLPPAQTQNGITYVTGGIGQPESTAMRDAAGNYDLMLTFAKANGAFLSDVTVDITDQHGNQVLSLVSDPILLVDLPQGTYKVRASFGGTPKERTVTIGRGHDRLAYTWPNAVDNTSDFSAFERGSTKESVPMTPPTDSSGMGRSEMGRSEMGR